ncbi:peptidase M23 [Candidatus Termititenax dinenymphae]|uniref:Peptidase M23 n=1 Tax=Candidatus Termititenax dinenymphae TaxID=2218523 RepID=A0A388TKH3_9BACT|nr:peptidase M23 [Candidatus Termititenax dinenymphae]
MLVLFILAAALCADSLSDKQKELNRLQAEIQRNQKLIQQTKVQENASLRDLSLINRSITKAKNDLDYNQKQLQVQAIALQQATADFEQSNAEYQKRQTAVRSRVREMYKTQDLGWLTLLLGNKSFSDLIDSTHHYRKILARDLKNVLELRSIRKELVEKRENLEYQRNIIESTKKSIEQQKVIYEQRAKKQDQITASLRAQRIAYERRSDALLKNSQEIETMIKKMIRDNPNAEARGSGKYIWPFKGIITSYYGNRLHPIFKTYKMHTGLDIADGTSGKPVKVTDSGVVTFSDWYGGYGNAVIVDHGHGISSLYGHMSKRLVKKGDKINKGQTVGLIGSTGYSTGPHLHFEIRKNGETVNPLDYLPPQ